MRKFILIDHSISGTGGHYLEYASNVLQEADRNCETYLVTNRLYTGKDSPCKGRTFSIYPYDIWGVIPHHEKKWEKIKGQIGELRAKIEKKALFTSICYFLLGFKSGTFFMTKRLTKRILIVLAFLALALVAAPLALLYIATRLFIRLISKILNFCDKVLHLPAGLSLRELIIKFFQTISKYTHGSNNITKAFYKATRKALRKTKPQSGDIIFIPTLSLADTRAVYQVLKNIPEAKTCRWFLLYRRNLFRGRDPGYQAQLNEQLEWRKVFASFIEYKNVRFLTDTEQLKDQYQTLGVVPFEVAPIPMNPSFQTKIREKPECFRIVYAGDARSEKGYQFFPDLAEHFALCENTSGVIFQLQSNFTFCEIRDDPPVVLARNRLEEIKSPDIQLIRNAISSEEYLDLVCNATVMPLLYDRNNYYARSSGALTEALAAGIPVVVPSASWLSLQVLPLIVKDQMQLQKQAERIPLSVGDTIGWYRGTDMNSAQAPKKESKKEPKAALSLINWDLIKEGLRKKKKFSASRLPVLGTKLNPTNLYQIPKNAQTMFVKFQMEESCGKGVFLRTAVKFYNQLGWEIGWNGMEHSRCEELNGICTAIFRIPAEAVYARMELSCPYNNCFAACLDFCIEFWKNGDFSLGGNGCIYVKNEQIYDCLAEIQRHLNAYWRRAQENAVNWNRFHSARNLVRMLLENEEKADYDS